MRLNPNMSWRQSGVIIMLVIAGLVAFGIIVDQIVLPWFTSTRSVAAVPNVIGKDVNEARLILEQAGLVVQEPKEQFSAKVEKGIVMSQLPAPNSDVKEGRNVYLTISKGYETVRMPSLTNMSLRDARLMLMRSGLGVGDVAYENHDSIPANRILFQSVPAGKDVPYGSNTDVVISQGPGGLRVPDVVGFSFEEAQARIVGLGLRVGEVRYESSGAFDANTVLGTFPPADSVVGKGAFIVVRVVK